MHGFFKRRISIDCALENPEVKQPVSKLVVMGGSRLDGSIRVPGAKNAILPILAASLLTDEPVTLHNCPKLLDVDNMLLILNTLGVKSRWEDTALLIDASGADRYEMPAHLSKELRSSIFMLGPLLARFGHAHCTFPGGCEIGHRPIDLHLKGLGALNVHIAEEYGDILCDGRDLQGNVVHLDYPSVGATENLMMAATAAAGDTVIQNAAREPEILDLQEFLKAMGCELSGAGTSTIWIRGGAKRHGAEYRIMPDRIVAGTLMCAGAITGGRIELLEARAEDCSSIVAKLREMGVELTVSDTAIKVASPWRLKECKLIETLPYPGFPTDMQAQMMAVCTVAQGTSIVVENVFENRYKHAAELVRMGADITIKDRTAVVRGMPELMGTEVVAKDLRGGAALCLAGLRAQGRTTIGSVEHIDRGYQQIECMLSQLGADIRRET